MLSMTFWHHKSHYLFVFNNIGVEEFEHLISWSEVQLNYAHADQSFHLVVVVS